ncbi:hypothetical protein GALL_158040 [mine drainage metagenome]|uniref:Uncharacterized protein n=1 Tax=mine drainage metagenome TaxID=410659 RepID=A0A1J5SDQ2_9ZZZZ
MHTLKTVRDAHSRTAILKGKELLPSSTGSISHRYYGTFCETTNLPVLGPLGQTFISQQGDLTKLLQLYTNNWITTGINPVIEEYKQALSIVVTPADMLKAVRDTFMLNVSDAARVFRVTRPTIYLWASLTDMEQIRARADRDRMKELFRISQKWTQLGKLTGRWTSMVLRSGQSIIDLLSAAIIDQKSILDAHAQLRAVAGSLNEAEAIRSLNAAKALAPAFDKLDALNERREKERKRY